MSFAELPKRLLSKLRLSWRLIALILVVPCFLMLLRLGDWSTSYAASDAWAKKVGDTGLEWSPIVSAAATVMASQEPESSYASKESFYRALSTYVKGRPGAEDKRNGKADKKEKKAVDSVLSRLNPDDQSSLTAYRQLRTQRDETLGVLRTFWQDSAEEASALAELRKRPASKQEIEESFATINEKNSRLVLIETRLQRLLADRESRLKASEDGSRAAFEAALPAARPVSRLPEMLQEFAIRVGDETNPLHILYVVAWYSLEGLIVVLLCIFFVPWLIRLVGDTSDPESLRRKFIERIKSLLASAFGQRAAAGVGKTVLTLALGGFALAGVSMAAGDSPSATTLLPPERVVVSGVAGEPGSPGVIPPELSEKLREQEEKLKKQAALIEILHGRITEVSQDTSKNRQHVEALVQEADIVVANLGRLSSGMGVLTSDISALNGSISGLSKSHQSILQAWTAANLRLSDSINHLGQATAAVGKRVEEVKTDVGLVEHAVGEVKDNLAKASRDLQPTAGDLLRITGVRSGILPGVNPFYRYAVTQAVVGTMTRAMQGLDETQKEQILAALEQMKNKPEPMKVWGFRSELHAACTACKSATLEQLMPLIEKVSRVKD